MSQSTLSRAQDAVWARISEDLAAAGYADAASEAACCSGSLWAACQDQTDLAGLRILEWPVPGRGLGIYTPANEEGRHDLVAGPYEDPDPREAEMAAEAAKQAAQIAAYDAERAS